MESALKCFSPPKVGSEFTWERDFSGKIYQKKGAGVFLQPRYVKKGGKVIRVVYRWRVKEEDFANFKEVWARTTNTIHETVPGALGSFMLRSPEDKAEVLTVAKWDSLENWKAFWVEENPTEMVGVREIGERISVTVYDEVEDFTR